MRKPMNAIKGAVVLLLIVGVYLGYKEWQKDRAATKFVRLSIDCYNKYAGVSREYAAQRNAAQSGSSAEKKVHLQECLAALDRLEVPRPGAPICDDILAWRQAARDEAMYTLGAMDAWSTDQRKVDELRRNLAATERKMREWCNETLPNWAQAMKMNLEASGR